MNSDRRVVAGVLADLCGAYSTQRTVPHKVLIILRDAVKGLADTEQRSIQRMEQYKDSPTTRQNYRNAVACHEDLRAAQEALEEGEIEEAWPLLVRVATDPTSATPEPEPVKKRRRK